MSGVILTDTRVLSTFLQSADEEDRCDDESPSDVIRKAPRTSSDELPLDEPPVCLPWGVPQAKQFAGVEMILTMDKEKKGGTTLVSLSTSSFSGSSATLGTLLESARGFIRP